jgi:hypothetical protein
MDLLPAGIAFGKPDGEVLFRNLAMNELSRALTGKDLSDLAFFRNMFSSENTYDIPITLPDGVSTWQTDYTYSEDNVISCYITDDGLLSVNITDPGSYEWRYDEDDSTGILSASDADFDGYHFTVEPSRENGTGYAVVAEYDQDAPEDAMPYSYGIVKYDIASGKISRISKISHKDDFP